MTKNKIGNQMVSREIRESFHLHFVKKKKSYFLLPKGIIRIWTNCMKLLPNIALYLVIIHTYRKRTYSSLCRTCSMIICFRSANQLIDVCGVVFVVAVVGFRKLFKTRLKFHSRMFKNVLHVLIRALFPIHLAHGACS